MWKAVLAGTVAALVSGSGLVLAHEMSAREGGLRWQPSAEDIKAFTDARIAALEAGLAQFVYLVLFSYAFFFEGFTGLAIAIGAILTLFIVMQMTGRIRWAEKFAVRGA